MKNTLVALLLFASVAMGLVAASATPVQNVQPNLVAVGENVELAHGTSYCKKRDKTTTVWSIEYISSRVINGRLYRYYLHEPRGAWNFIYGSHIERNRC